MTEKSSLGTRQTDGNNLAWFGEIERKLAKLIPTFTYHFMSKTQQVSAFYEQGMQLILKMYSPRCS
jgi:hypothetical protein